MTDRSLSDQDPQDAGRTTALSIIPFAEYEGGGYGVTGGIREIPRVIDRLSNELSRDIESKTMSYRGALSGISSNT